ncbi:MAG TPA: SHOCT domain-containing protein [Chloroflexota bacterium]|nr:SHOCT domain-containing protein [Chloroflexota bacterium]
MWWLYGTGWHGFIPFFPLMPLVWLLVVGLIVFVVARRWQGPSGLGQAREILAERLARGDISPSEYRERLEALG